MGLFRKKVLPEKAETYQGHEAFESFLTNEYLGRKYIVPDHIDTALRGTAELLSTQSGFYGLVNVGGTANGSYEWRSRTNYRHASDLDFYLIGYSSLDLRAASNGVREQMAAAGLNADGELNGMNPENYLNTDELDLIIDRGDVPQLGSPYYNYVLKWHKSQLYGYVKIFKLKITSGWLPS